MVPSGWVKRTIDDIAHVSSGGTPSRSEPLYWGGTIPWVTTAEVDFCEIVDTNEKITEIGLNNSSAKLFPAGTILMAMYGQGKTRGKVAKLAIEASTNQACAAILLKESYSVDFYFQYLLSQYENVRELSNSGGQENLSGAIVKSIPVPVPPLEEQTKIAKILSIWDRAITATEKLLANSQQQKKALMQKLLTRKVRLLDESGVRFEEEWQYLSIREASSCITKGTTPSTNGFEFRAQGIPFIKVESIRDDGTIDFNKVAYIDVACHLAFKRSQLKAGDILFSIAGALGRVALVPHFLEQANTNQAVCLIRLKTEVIDKAYCYYILQSERIQREILAEAVQAAQPNLSLKNIGDFKVPVPNLMEQEKISVVLSCADQEISLFQQKLDKLKNEKKALMQQLFTGKRRVSIN